MATNRSLRLSAQPVTEIRPASLRLREPGVDLGDRLGLGDVVRAGLPRVGQRAGALRRLRPQGAREGEARLALERRAHVGRDARGDGLLERRDRLAGLSEAEEGQALA